VIITGSLTASWRMISKLAPPDPMMIAARSVVRSYVPSARTYSTSRRDRR